MSMSNSARGLRPHPHLQRVVRRARANLRVVAPIAEPVRDPLARAESGVISRLGRGAWILIGAALVHVMILGGFVVANAISRTFEEPEVIEEQPTEVSMVDEPKAETDVPEPEPELDSTPPVESFEPAIGPVEAAQPIGISEDSTVEAGGGPAFQVGSSLAGPSAGGSLAREILAEQAHAAGEAVMTGETVDTAARPLGSNRAPTPPSAAAKKRVSGFVVVQLMIDEQGAVRETKILQSEPAGFFDEAVLEVVPSWRFTPATYQGRPVTLRVEQTIRFDLG